MNTKDQQDKKVITIEIGNVCLKVNPCRHRVKFHYSNATIETKLITDKEIANKYWNHIIPAHRRHFEHHREQKSD